MSERTPPLKIAIVGAGIGGLCAASMLRRIGIDVRIFEQAQRFARVGAGIQIPPNAMKVLRTIGAEPELRRIGLLPKTNLNLEHDTGKITNDLPLAETAEEKYGAPFLCIHRADVHATLEALLPANTVRLGAKLVGFDQGSSGVTVSFADGERERFDALIGADGIHSVVREGLVGPQTARYTGRVAYRATYPSSRLNGLTFPLSRIKWWGPDRHVVAYYTRSNLEEFYVTTVLPEPGEWITAESWSAEGDVEYVLSSFREFHPSVRSALEACPSIYKWAIQEREPMERWSEGNITLLGDACHSMTPHMAQGAAQAIEDAAILARCLDGVGRDGVEDAFKRYEMIRKPRTTTISTMASHNQWMHKKTNPDWVFGYDALTAPLAA